MPGRRPKIKTKTRSDPVWGQARKHGPGKRAIFRTALGLVSETYVVWKRNSKLLLTHHAQAFFRAIDVQERIRLPPSRHNDRADAVSCTCSNVSLMTLPLTQPHWQTDPTPVWWHGQT